MNSAARSFGRAAISAFLLQIALTFCGLAIAPTTAAAELHNADLNPIAQIVHHEIAAGRIPGAVIEIGQGDRLVYRNAFGCREREPACVAMMPDAVFDLASLTKPVATAAAIMRLRDLGKVDLDLPAAKYWPAFGRNGKERITIRELMTHYSGLRADLDLRRKWQGYESALELIEAERPVHPPGTRYLYSDINFEVLGEIVRRISGLPLNEFCRANIFLPLHMADTGFKPAGTELAEIAPTGYSHGKLLLGEVNDPSADRMGGIAGHAGLFSTADDLAKFSRMMLDGGRLGPAQILSDRAIDLMTMPESPPDASRMRGLGWDLAAPLASNRDRLAPVGSYGHTGFTGTMVWIDPVSATYVIVLTNRTYPYGRGDAAPLRKAILSLISNRLGPVSESEVAAKCPGLA
ncbi:MAG TPA: serine hydrolase domain-containing protein, partial [Candidatus Binataceae bacterium]|nr:serine hydrolase domain-containing protein [Candidatus Binataceae bacterium]